MDGIYGIYGAETRELLRDGKIVDGKLVPAVVGGEDELLMVWADGQPRTTAMQPLAMGTVWTTVTSLEPRVMQPGTYPDPALRIT